MAQVKNLASGLVWDVNDEQAVYFTKFHGDEYELVDGNEATDSDGGTHGGPAGPDDKLGEMTHPELQAEAKALDLPTSGKKAELIEAIRAKRAELVQ